MLRFLSYVLLAISFMAAVRMLIGVRMRHDAKQYWGAILALVVFNFTLMAMLTNDAVAN
jgi:hypothetical protein